VPSDKVPKVYRLNHVKRLHASNAATFEGQLPKLRYYHHIKKVEPQEENNNKLMPVKSWPITASSKKNESNGQMKITGEDVNGLSRKRLKASFDRFQNENYCCN
jgi:hypothetical protein